MSSRQYYKKIGEVNYDRKLLEKAQRLARANGGTLNVVAVEKLWKDIRSDGTDKDHVDGVWDVELRTIKYIAENFRHDAAASARDSAGRTLLANGLDEVLLANGLLLRACCRASCCCGDPLLGIQTRECSRYSLRDPCTLAAATWTDPCSYVAGW